MIDFKKEREILRTYIGNLVDSDELSIIKYNSRNTRMKKEYYISTCISFIKRYPAVKNYVLNFLKNNKEVNINFVLMNVCRPTYEATLDTM
jgi:hypothetical protein